MDKTETDIFPLGVYCSSEKGRGFELNSGVAKTIFTFQNTSLKCQCYSTIHVNVMGFMAFYCIEMNFSVQEWIGKVIISQAIYGFMAMQVLGQKQ